MRYLGGKTRVLPKFAPILREALRERGGRLLEPFVGGFNTVPNVYDDLIAAVCCDLHPALTTLYRALQNGWEPPDTLTLEEWRELREHDDRSDPLTAFAGFGCSFAGLYFSTYARDKAGEVDPSISAGRAKRSLLRKREFMDRVAFFTADYRELRPYDQVIYADPPYRDVTPYSINKDDPFNHDEFWTWCHKAAQRGSRVFVSEFTPPTDIPHAVRWTKARKVQVTSRAEDGPKKDRVEMLIEVLP